VGSQFLAESVMLSALGGVGGVVLGAVATTAYALASRQSVVVPLPAIGEGVAVALSVGLLAGVYPAVRAARLTPTEALRAT
jgi:putative ABC transport system permease protein